MGAPMSSDPFLRVARARLLPAVAALETPEQAVHLARAYLAAGLDVMEITLRHPAAFECIAAIRAEVPEMLCGAGTVLNGEQVEALATAGVPFAVSPGFHPVVIEAARESHLPFAPGVATPGELEQALALGCTYAKPFPVEALGGVRWLRALSGPYSHTGIGLIPMGGITVRSLTSYLALPFVTAVGLSALSPPDLVRSGQWEEITLRTRELLALLDPQPE